MACSGPPAPRTPHNALSPEAYDLRVAAAGVEVACERRSEPGGDVWLEAILPEALARAEEGRVRLHVDSGAARRVR